MNAHGKRMQTLVSGAIVVLVACAAFYAGRHVGMDAAEAEFSSTEELADTVSMKALDSIQSPVNPPQAGAVNNLSTPVGNLDTPIEALRKTTSLPESDSSESEPPRYSARPIGKLGQPLGTLMTIQGEDAEERYKLGNCLLVTHDQRRGTRQSHPDQHRGQKSFGSLREAHYGIRNWENDWHSPGNQRLNQSAGWMAILL
jgi:hypothetical protein